MTALGQAGGDPPGVQLVTVELVGGADDVDGIGAGRGSVGVCVDSVGAVPGVVGGRDRVAGTRSGSSGGAGDLQVQPIRDPLNG
ncbi:hypothetical protein, partial [Rhodococcus sp. T2V]|uniref:hypothetical protein n=1 Tax=Rhodococcus sp. T2V TaxID=3034164 RepID=UPI0023E27542